MKSKRLTSVLLVALALTCLGWGNPGVSLVEEGNLLYGEGDWEGALAKYNEALLELPEAREILYNIGGVSYRQGDLEKAAALYKSILEAPDPALAARASYNLGNTLFQGQQYPAAVEAFKTALKLAPTDEDARYNYELALKMIQNQEQEQQDQDQDEEQDQDQDQEPDEPQSRSYRAAPDNE